MWVKNRFRVAEIQSRGSLHEQDDELRARVQFVSVDNLDREFYIKREGIGSDRDLNQDDIY